MGGGCFQQVVSDKAWGGHFKSVPLKRLSVGLKGGVHLPKLLKVIISVVVLILGVLLVLLVAAKLTGFGTISALVSYLFAYLDFIVDRSF